MLYKGVDIEYTHQNFLRKLSTTNETIIYKRVACCETETKHLLNEQYCDQH